MCREENKRRNCVFCYLLSLRRRARRVVYVLRKTVDVRGWKMFCATWWIWVKAADANFVLSTLVYLHANARLYLAGWRARRAQKALAIWKFMRAARHYTFRRLSGCVWKQLSAEGWSAQGTVSDVCMTHMTYKNINNSISQCHILSHSWHYRDIFAFLDQFKIWKK